MTRAGRTTGRAVRTLACAGLAAAMVPAVASAAPRDMNDHSSDPAYRAYFSQTLSWSEATCKGTAPRMECARVRVPKDWARPRAGSLHIVISRPVKAPTRPRVLFTNPGGPGLPGLATSAVGVETQGLAKTHTPIGIDPRGVGLSSIQVCPGYTPLVKRYTALDSRTLTEEQVRTFAAERAEVFRRCSRQKGSILRYIDTPSAIRDAVLVMDLLRLRSVDYWGGSYGSWYGTVAARMFPTRFDRVVTDANVDSGQRRLTAVNDFTSESHQRSYDRAVLPWLARHNAELGLGADPVAVEATIERIRAAAKARQFGPEITERTVDELRYNAARDLTMSSNVFAFAFSALRKALDGDRSDLPMAAKALGEVASPTKLKASGLWEANTAYFCNDSGPGPSAADAARTAIARNRLYPVVNVLESVPACTGWPQSARWTAADARRPMRVLMTQSENDAPTGYPGARHGRFASRGLVRMVMLDDATSHGASSDPCVTRVANRFLARGIFPTRDVHCQAPPLPGDRQVFEFGNPASARTPLPLLPPYRVRDFTPPSVDPTAPTNPQPDPVLQK